MLVTSLSGQVFYFTATTNSTVMKGEHLKSALLAQCTFPSATFLFTDSRLTAGDTINSLNSVLLQIPWKLVWFLLRVSSQAIPPFFLALYLRGQVAQQQPAAASGCHTITPSWAYRVKGKVRQTEQTTRMKQLAGITPKIMTIFKWRQV